ncbi:MAG: DNRLRE domain-containing protein [Ferruginibacter sp.]
MKLKLLSTLLLLGSLCQAQTLTPTEDAMVYKGNTGNNYGADLKLQVKKTEGSGVTRNAYLKFDITSITTAQVGKATLRLYCNNKAFDSIQSVMAVYAAANSWTEAGINWNNAPPVTSNITSTVVVSKFSYYEWDVTDYIKQSIPLGNLVSLAVADVNFSNNLVEFSSKEAVNKPQLVISPVAETAATAYYLDGVDGNDANDGKTNSTAWKTLNKINTSNLSAGAKIYFRSGQSFNGLFNISNNGTSGSPVVCDVYGGTDPATINGKGQPTAIFAYNRSYIELKNLVVTNFRSGVIAASDAFNAVYFVNDNGGTLNHIHIENVRVDSVNSSSDVDAATSVYNGGVQFYSTGTLVPSCFNDVLIQNCTFQNLSRTGCNFRSDWDLRNVNTSFGDNLGDGRTDNWTPNTNVQIKNNLFRQITGNGLIVRVAFKALIEGNLFDSCGTVISGNAVFNFNTDSCVYQFNEAKNTVYNNGDTDARGIDADFRTKSTIIQYNYLHNNGLGGVVATGGDQTAGQIPQRFNVTSVIRYNLIENNDRQGIAFSGALDGIDVYNNTFYADASHTDVVIVRSAIWAVAPKNTRFKNNIFYYTGTNPSYSFASGSTYNFTNNLFYGIHPASEPADAAKITGDPKLSNPGSQDGYKYLDGSAALNSGMLIPDNGGRDYYNVAVSSSTNPNVGLYNGPSIGTIPVKLINFFARKSAGTTVLTWTTTIEINTSRFEIERSANGIDFQKSGTVNAAGNSATAINYSFNDLHPLKGLNYYRLKQVDLDGKFTYSDIRLLNYDDTKKQLIIYPNPAADKISLIGNTNVDAPVTISIYDIQGKKIKEISIASFSNMDINISELSRGIYSVRIYHAATKEIFGEARFLKL